MKLIRVLPDAETSDVIEALIGLSRYSAAELARRADIAEGQVSKWRRGLVEPTVPLLLKLAAAAGFELALAQRQEQDQGPTAEEAPHLCPVHHTELRWGQCVECGPDGDEA